MDFVLYPNRALVPFSHVVVLFFLLSLLWIPAFVWLVHQLPELWFYDKVEHVLGGIFLCALCCYLWRGECPSGLMFFFLCLGVVALGGVTWEVGWYYFRKVTIGNPEVFIALNDTITDIVSDLGGGLFGWMYYHIPRGLAVRV